MNPTTEYNKAVTLTKALGIILMVFAHAIDNPPEPGIYMGLWRVIYAFHMPLFFIMSGFCFKELYLEAPVQFFLRKIKGLYLPFVAFSLVFLAFHNLFRQWHICEGSEVYRWHDFLVAAWAVIGRMSDGVDLLGTFWFIKELFFGNLIFYLVLLLFRRNKWLTAAVLFALTEVLAITGFCIPWFGLTNRTFFAATFITIGYIIRTTDFRLDKWWKWLLCVVFIVAETAGVNFKMDTQTPWTLPLYLCSAIAGTMMVYELAVWLEKYIKTSVLTFIGQHTFPVLALHFLSFKLVSLLIIAIYHLPIESLTAFPVLSTYSFTGWWLVYTLVGLALPLFLAWLYSLIWQRSLTMSERTPRG